MATDESPIDPPETTPYLVSASLRQRLDLIHHLIGFGRQIIVVRGKPGSGRSRLIATVCDEANADWLVIEIGGQGVDSPSQLLEVLLDALEPGAGERPHSAEDQEARVCRQLAEMHSQHRVAVLLVDDCDAFNAEVNALLFRLAYTGNGVGELRVVLSCGADTAYLEELQAQSPQATLLHVVDVPPLGESEIATLAQRFATEPQAIDAYTIAALTERSGGNPGRLLEILASTPPPAQRPESRQPPAAGAAGGAATDTPAAAPRGHRIKQVAGVGLVILAALGLAALTLVNRERGSTPEPGIELPLREMPGSSAPAPGNATLHSSEASLVAATDDAAATPSVPLEPQPEPVRSASDEPTPDDDAPPLESGPQTEPPAADTARPQTATASPLPAPAEMVADPPAAAAAEAPAQAPTAGIVDDEPAPPTAVSPVPAAAASPRPAPLPPRAPASPAYSAKWVLTQPDKSFVIQLFGVRDRAAAERFIRSAGLSDKAAVFDLEHEAAPWYVVALGHFPDRAAARAAIAALPAPLRASGPWARSVASLRE